MQIIGHPIETGTWGRGGMQTFRQYATSRFATVAGGYRTALPWREYWRRGRAEAVAWRQRARSRRELSALDDRALHDLNLTRCDAWHEASKPPWRS